MMPFIRDLLLPEAGIKNIDFVFSTTAGQARTAVAAAIPAWTALNQSAIAFDENATNPTV